jgi:hypothetical protein
MVNVQVFRLRLTSCIEIVAQSGVFLIRLPPVALSVEILGPLEELSSLIPTPNTNHLAAVHDHFAAVFLIPDRRPVEGDRRLVPMDGSPY